MLVPPLRDRPEDIPLLVEHFMRQFRPTGRSSVAPRGPRAPAAATPGWGTSASCATSIERACALSRGAQLEIDDALEERPAGAGATARPTSICRSRRRRPRSSTRFERGYIDALLKRHEGNLSAAARAAEIDRKHLRELLRKHGLRESSE